MIENRVMRVTPARIEFNVGKEKKEFNIRSEIVTLLKKMWEVDNSLKVVSTVDTKKNGARWIVYQKTKTSTYTSKRKN